MIRLHALALALCLVACREQPSAAIVQNACLENVNCERSETCDPEIYACVRTKTIEAYELVVRVSATSEGTMLADAGVRLVSESVHELGSLRGQRDQEVLRVPELALVPGWVRADAGGKMELLASQLTFVPRGASAPVAAPVVDTPADALQRDAGAPQFHAPLDPNLAYDVRVQPLLHSSVNFPPLVVSDAVNGEAVDITYGPVEPRSGRFLYRGEEPIAARVRLEERGSGRVVSSTTPVTNQVGVDGQLEGRFTLYAAPEVFQRGNFDLVISIAGFDPWQATITVDGERFLTGGSMLLPAVPETVRASNRVEDERGGKLANVELIFVSSFPVLKAPGDPLDPPPPVFETDWCRWDLIRCAARFRTMSDEQGLYVVDLIPGEYDVFIIPRQGEPSSQGLIVTKHGEGLIVNAGALPGSVILMGRRAKPYTGTVLASKAKLPAVGVTVHALRRPTPAFSSWGEVADFNRSLSTQTDRKGHFQLLADVGYYDFVVEPPRGSNFPWKLWLDCPNGPGAGGPLAPITMSAPVMVTGVVEHEGSGTRLPNARIAAFARVEEKNGGQRSVLIGRAVSDERGAYRLLLPALVGEDDEKCEGKVVTGSAR